MVIVSKILHFYVFCFSYGRYEFLKIFPNFNDLLPSYDSSKFTAMFSKNWFLPRRATLTQKCLCACIGFSLWPCPILMLLFREANQCTWVFLVFWLCIIFMMKINHKIPVNWLASVNIELQENFFWCMYGLLTSTIIEEAIWVWKSLFQIRLRCL